MKIVPQKHKILSIASDVSMKCCWIWSNKHGLVGALQFESERELIDLQFTSIKFWFQHIFAISYCWVHLNSSDFNWMHKVSLKALKCPNRFQSNLIRPKINRMSIYNFENILKISDLLIFCIFLFHNVKFTLVLNIENVYFINYANLRYEFQFISRKFESYRRHHHHHFGTKLL